MPLAPGSGSALVVGDAFGSVRTGDVPFPQLRALTLNDVSTRALLGITHGPSGGGTGKAAGEQRLLDTAIGQYPRLFTKDRIWLMDRNFPGAARLTVPVRVIEYYVTLDGLDVPEMFCLVTDLTDIKEHPAPQLAGLYKWRWDGSPPRPR